MLIECLGSGEDNVELIEQICFALNVYITANGKRYDIKNRSVLPLMYISLLMVRDMPFR